MYEFRSMSRFFAGWILRQVIDFPPLTVTFLTKTRLTTDPLERLFGNRIIVSAPVATATVYEGIPIIHIRLCLKH
jgi:hypothetical protein